MFEYYTKKNWVVNEIARNDFVLCHRECKRSDLISSGLLRLPNGILAMTPYNFVLRGRQVEEILDMLDQ
jgi:hypothetical protein